MDLNRRRYIGLASGLLAAGAGGICGSAAGVHEPDTEDEPLNWSATYNDPANTGHLSPQAGLSEAPEVSWQRTEGDSVGAGSFIIVHGGVAVLAPYAGGGLMAVDRASGDPIWSKDVAVRNPMTAVGDTLFAAFNPASDRVGAFSLRDGSLLWDRPVGGYSGGLVADAGTVFHQETEAVRALDADSGDVLWSVREDRGTSGGVNGIAPAYHDGVVYTPAANYRTLLALDAETGETLWETDGLPEGNYDFLKTPVVANDVVLAQDSRKLYCVEQSTGERRWTQSSGGQKTNPVTDGEAIYLADAQEGILRIGFDAGNVERLVEQSGSIPLTVGSDNLYLNEESSVRAYDKQSGEEVWRLEKEGSSGSPGDASPPIVLDGSVYYHDDGQFTKLSSPSEESPATPTATSTQSPTPTEVTVQTVGESGPGFGVGAALSGVAGSLFVANWLRERRDD